MSPSPVLPMGTKIVVGSFATSGVVHLVAPRVFEPLIPRALGAPRPWVWASGLAELGCAAGLVTRRRWAPAATAATLGVIWVGNWSMAVQWQRSSRRTTLQRASAWARLPLQLPLMWWAWNSPTGTSGTGGSGGSVAPARRLDP